MTVPALPRAMAFRGRHDETPPARPALCPVGTEAVPLNPRLRRFDS